LTTKQFNPDDTLWKPAYEPLKHIDQSIFNSTILNINITELNNTIKDLPNKKAPGLTNISYETLQALGPSAKNILLTLYNKILINREVPYH